MERIYFFQPLNRMNESIFDTFIHCDEKVASKYYRKPNRFLYLGWSTGEFIKAVASKNQAKVDKDTGMTLDYDNETKERIREAIKQEINFAKDNTDKAPPRDYSRMSLDGGQLEARLKAKMLNMPQ